MWFSFTFAKSCLHLDQIIRGNFWQKEIMLPQHGKIDELCLPTGEIEVSSINILIIIIENIVNIKNSGSRNGSYEFHCILNASVVPSV